MTSPSTATESPLITSIRPRLHRNLTPLFNESSRCLPILQSTCQQILNHMDPHSSAADLAQVISRDHGLTCKVLQVANSIAYSPQQMISSVPHAVSWLGYDTIRALVAAAHLVEQLQHWPIRQKEFQSLIAKSLISATFANELGVATRYPQSGQLFTAALLYSIGDLAIAYQDPDLFEALQAVSRKFTNPEARILQETRLIGIPRLTLAQALGHMWKLPDELIELFRTQEALPMGRWTNGFPAYQGIVVGSIQLVEAMTNPAMQDPIEESRRTILRGSGLSSGSFADIMTRAMDRGRQLIHSMGLALDFSNGARERQLSETSLNPSRCNLPRNRPSGSNRFLLPQQTLPSVRFTSSHLRHSRPFRSRYKVRSISMTFSEDLSKPCIRTWDSTVCVWPSSIKTTAICLSAAGRLASPLWHPTSVPSQDHSAGSISFFSRLSSKSIRFWFKTFPDKHLDTSSGNLSMSGNQRRLSLYRCGWV